MTVAETIRAQARSRLREAMLDEAYAQTRAKGWAAVRIGSVAAAVGVSRQSVHAEFGTKEGLGEALVLRESEVFLAAVLAEMHRNAADPATAVRRGATLALEMLPQHPLLRAALTGQGDSLLPAFTTRSGPLLAQATDAVSRWVLQRSPAADPARVHHLVAAVVRLVISYSVTPDGSPAAAGQRLGDLFAAGMAWPRAASTDGADSTGRSRSTAKAPVATSSADTLAQ